MIGLALLYLIPFVYTVSTSLKTQAEVAAGFDLWPSEATLAAYREIWSREDLSFVTFFKNSLIVSGSITLITLFLATLGGYAFARLRFPFREPLFLLVLGTLMIPDQLRLVPVYLMMIDFPLTGWNLTQTLHGYVFFGSSIALATCLFLMRQYFLTIPKDYEEAAKLDGAGYFKTYWRIMLPLAAPAVAAVAILTFQGIWNEFFWANLLLTGDNSNYTVQMGLVQFRFQYQTLWPQLMAAATIAILRCSWCTSFFQRYFVAGVAAAGVKDDRRGRTIQPPGVGEALRGAVRDFYEVLALRGAQLGPLRVRARRARRRRRSSARARAASGRGAASRALVSAAVTVVETGSLTFIETTAGLRRCLARGLALGAMLAAGILATVVAFRFYGDAGVLAWPLAVSSSTAAIFALYQIHLWPSPSASRSGPSARSSRRRGSRSCGARGRRSVSGWRCSR